MEVTPNDNRTVGITYYNGQKIIIPAQELIDLSWSAGKGPAETRRQKLLSSMIGAEISYIIVGLDNNTHTVVASRLKANDHQAGEEILKLTDKNNLIREKKGYNHFICLNLYFPLSSSIDSIRSSFFILLIISLAGERVNPNRLIISTRENNSE